MATAIQTSIRLGAEDVIILDVIQKRTGLVTRADALRFALRQYARAEGIEYDLPKPKKPKK